MDLSRKYKGKISEKYRGDGSIAIFRYHGGRYGLCTSDSERDLLRSIDHLREPGGFGIEMSIDFPIKGNENPMQPSLLGVDFMLKTKAKLFFDPSKKEAYFEIPG